MTHCPLLRWAGTGPEPELTHLSVLPDCVDDRYLFGRDATCDYVLDDPQDRKSKRFRIYSKKHFRIYRVGTGPLVPVVQQECLSCDWFSLTCPHLSSLCPQEGSEVFVEDYSNNGTFVDGVKVGQNKKLPLTNNAVLSLAEQRNRGDAPESYDHSPGLPASV